MAQEAKQRQGGWPGLREYQLKEAHDSDLLSKEALVFNQSRLSVEHSSVCSAELVILMKVTVVEAAEELFQPRKWRCLQHVDLKQPRCYNLKTLASIAVISTQPDGKQEEVLRCNGEENSNCENSGSPDSRWGAAEALRSCKHFPPEVLQVKCPLLGPDPPTTQLR